MKIVFAGGGTGGHILPIVAIARELQKSVSDQQLQLHYIGPKDMFGEMTLEQEGLRIHRIFAGKLRRTGGIGAWLKNIFDICVLLPLGILWALKIVLFLWPDAIVSKGGYGALPVTIAGWLLRRPVFLHESDIAPGLANRIGGKFALEIFTSFQRTEYFSAKKMLFVGNPIRRELLTGDQQEAARLFQLTNEKPVLLILGGSQGAQRVNNIILEILAKLLESFEVIHQTGKRNFEQVRKEGKVVVTQDNLRFYHPLPFLTEPELKHAYATASLVVSRAGSGSIFEISARGIPAVLIPLPESAQNHQLKNAYGYAAFDFSKPNAAYIIAHYLLEYLKR